ncbi:MAG: hypothetical protein L0Y50_12455 [Beijerinckiaceae bacterium]|nr:hypothetical protein [Beijerinckiaceae bacterium]
MTARDQAKDALAAGTLAPGAGEASPVRLPPICVRTGADEVAGFLRETGGVGTGDFVPLTFPFRWLALPTIRGKILQMSGGENFLPVHEAQSFAYQQSLRTGADYVLCVEIKPVEKPPRLIVKMTVTAGQGELCAELEAILRIVRLARETAP